LVERPSELKHDINQEPEKKHQIKKALKGFLGALAAKKEAVCGEVGVKGQRAD